MTVLTEIPLEFESYLRDKTLQNLPTNLNEFIFAYIPNLDLSVDIDRNSTIPNESLIVHKAPVASVGKTGENAIVYSAIIDSTVNEFTFNAIYLHDKNEGNSCGMIIHQQDETKQQAMTITKSALMQYDSAAASANVTVDAETWQVDISDLFAACSKIGHTHTLDEVGGSNPNLFINGDFSINQRGENSSGWIADRWICAASGLTSSLRYTTIDLLDFVTDRLVASSAGAILKDASTTYNYATITQKIENFTPFINNKVTISGVLRVLDGGVYRTDTIGKYFERIQIRLVASGSFVGGASSYASNWKFRVDDNDNRYVHFSTTLDLPPVDENNITHADVIIWLTPTNLTWTAIDITNMKCEEGDTATIFVPDGHAANLAKCRLYCRKVELFDQGFALGYLATTAPHGFWTEVIDFTAGMRSLPAFTYGFYGENRMRIINLGAKTKASEIEQLALGGTVSAPRFEGVYTPPFSGTDDSFATLYFGTGWMLFEAEI